VTLSPVETEAAEVLLPANDHRHVPEVVAVAVVFSLPSVAEVTVLTVV
jgi:hypothetical protein